MQGIDKDYESLSDLVKAKRKEQGLNQADLAVSMRKSRHWGIQLEKGEWYGWDREFKLEPEMAVKLARILDTDPYEVLELGKVTREEWPDLSYNLADGVNARAVDVTALTDSQVRLVKQLVHELAKANDSEMMPDR